MISQIHWIRQIFYIYDGFLYAGRFFGNLTYKEVAFSWGDKKRITFSSAEIFLNIKGTLYVE